MFPITVTIKNQDELNAVMKALKVNIVSSLTSKDYAKKNETTCVSNDESNWGVYDDYKNSIEYQTVAKVVIEVAKRHGRDFAVELLEKVAGVKTLPESKPSQADLIIESFKNNL